MMKRVIFFALGILIMGIINNHLLPAVSQEVVDTQNLETIKEEGSKKCSISGRCTDSDSGVGIPNVKIECMKADKVALTDSDGIYSLKNLNPGEYTLKFFPPHPFCCKFIGRQCQKTFILKSGDKIVFDKVFYIGGSLSGKIYKAVGRPLKGVKVYATSYNGSILSTKTKEDGSYFIGSLSPSCDYSIIFYHDITGYSNRLITGIEVEKDICTEVQDVIFNLNDKTGFEGYAKSSLDGYPLPDLKVIVYYKYKKETGDDYRIVLLLCGYLRTDSNGYFRMNGIEYPGTYDVSLYPPIPPPKHPKIGEPFYELPEILKYRQRLKVNVKNGKMTKVFVTLDIPSYAPMKKDKKSLS
jgi:hypothetical protein